MRRLLETAVDEVEISDVIWGAANRHVAMWLVRGRRRGLADRAPVLFEMIWRGIASEQTLVG